MTPTSLKTLTWGTIAAAVVSAALLAALDAGLPGAQGVDPVRAQGALPPDGNGTTARHESLRPAQREPSAGGPAARH